MFSYRVFGIVKRELKEKLFSKSFILTTVLFPLFLFLIGGIQALLHSDEAKTILTIISEEQKLTESLQKELLSSGLIKEGKYSFGFRTMNREDLKKYLADNKKAMLDDKLTGVVFVPNGVMKDKKLEYYSKSPTNLSLSRKMEGPINKVLIDSYFHNRSLSSEELDFARKGIDFSGYKVSKDEKIKEEGYGSLILSYVFAILLYLSLIMSGQMMLQSVIEEKASRIVEVILSSVSPREMMTGKIVGSSITALMQMSIWLAAIVTVASSAIFVLPPEVMVSIKTSQVVFLLINYGVGLILFLSLFGMVGSIFDNPQDAQSGMWPVMMLVMIPFFIAMAMLENPNSPIGSVASFLPFTSVIVMPVKMTVVEVPIWQLAITILVNIATIIFVFPVAGKIYRVGILRTGKKPKWSEVVKWLKYKY
jgi:ABC-2 type transport system permease protein